MNDAATEREQEHWVVPSTGTRIPIPAGASDDEVGAILIEHPELRARFERARQNQAEGKGIPAKDLYAELGYTPPSQRRPSGRRPKGDSGNVRVRMPRRLHKELAEQADREGVSLNTLIVTYLAHEAGVQSARTE